LDIQIMGCTNRAEILKYDLVVLKRTLKCQRVPQLTLVGL